MIEDRRVRTARETTRQRTRIERKIRGKLQLQYGALKPYLVPKVGTHDGEIVFCETSYYFMLKVIGGSGGCVPVTFLVSPAEFFDGLFHTVIEMLLFVS